MLSDVRYRSRATSQVVDVGFVGGEISRVAEPTYGLGDAATEAIESAVRGLPTEQRACFLVARPQALDLAERRTHALFFALQLDVHFHHGCDGARGVADGR